jgi:hypothetical protein
MKKTTVMSLVLLLGSNLVSCTGKEEDSSIRVSRNGKAVTATLPTRLEAEDYVAAYETTAYENSGGACDRGDGVDMEITGDSEGGNCNIGWTASGEWVEYEFDAGSGGTFDIYGRVAGEYSGKTFRFELDGVNEGGELAAPSNGWQNYSDVGVNDVEISAGMHTLRVVFSTGDTNLNWIDISGEPIATCSDGIQNQGETGVDCGGPCEPCEGTQIAEVRVSASSDDAEERVSTGDMYLTSTDLELVEDDSSTRSQFVGIRFDGLSIPQGAALTAAWIEFTVDEPDEDSVEVVILAEASDDAETFTTDVGNISSRDLTDAMVEWSPSEWSDEGDLQQTPDISSVVQEVIDRPSWVLGNALVIVISGSGERTAESYDGSPDDAPLLHVEYEVSSCEPKTCESLGAECGIIGDGCGNELDCGECNEGAVCNENLCVIVTPTCDDNIQNGDESDVDCGGSCSPCDDFLSCFVGSDCISKVCLDDTCQPASCSDGVRNGDETGIDCGGSCDPCEETTITEVRVDASSDDAEEALSDGDVNLISTDLELGQQGTVSGAQVVGIRFAGLSVPKDATISAAWIEFTVDETDSGETDLVILAEAVDDAATFTISQFNVTSRTLTNSVVAWAPPPWSTVGETHQTPDISSLIQEVVDRPGWSEGNALAIIISGSGERTAESYDGRPGSAPLLHVEYTQSGICVPGTCESLGAECGIIDNGCGVDLDCGGCAEGFICDENVCECAPTTCEAEEAECGEISDNCGGTLDCGSCGEGEHCNAENKCEGECAPTTCEVEEAECGEISDNCGGTLDCGSCSEGEQCNNDTNVCEPISSCEDRVQNGDETDIDCGGSCPLACADGQHCIVGADCISQVCVDEICEAPTCDDGVKNGDEEQVDCGGPDCDPCVEPNIPGRIEAEDYVDYNDSDTTNEGAGDYPSCDNGDGVDLGENNDTGGSCTVGWTTNGEWLEFDLEVGAAANFDIVARAGSGTDNGAFRVVIDGVNVSGTLHTNNIGWDAFETLEVASDVTLQAGNHTMRVVFMGSMNLNWIEFTEVGVCIPETCETAGAECGTIDDNCGNTLDCGTCSDGETCNAANQCVQEGEGCTCPSGCESVENGTSPFTADGVDDSCYFFSGSMGSYVNSWNTALVDINGNDFTNVYVASDQYPTQVDGGYYVYVKSTVNWGHLEVRN